MSNSSASSVGGDGGGGSTPWQTASTVVAQPVSGSHVFKVDGYTRTKGFGVSNCITSGTFAVGGHRWCIKYYPDSCSYYGNWVSINLCLDHSDANEVKAQYEISLLGQDGQPAYTRLTRNTFSNKNRQFGFPSFVERKDSEKSVYLRDDVLRVRCDVTVIKDVVTQDISPCVLVPPSDMFRHLGWLLSAGEGADVTFEVGGERFAAHRCILATRSPVFKAELFGLMKEKTDTRVRVDDMEAKVFKAMLHFIYTDSLSDMDEAEKTAMAQHLLVAADRRSFLSLEVVGVEIAKNSLTLICEEKLCKHIGTGTVATTLALSEQHGCHGLKEACFNFLKSSGNMKAVVASDDFEHLKRSCPFILEELVTKLAP